MTAAASLGVGGSATISHPQTTQISQIQKKQQPQKGTRSTKKEIPSLSCAFCAFLWLTLCVIRVICGQSRPSESLTVAARPGIAAHVVSAFFPETGLVFGKKAHALNPLCGFPRVELRNDQTHGAAVLGRNRRAIVQ